MKISRREKLVIQTSFLVWLCSFMGVTISKCAGGKIDDGAEKQSSTLCLHWESVRGEKKVKGTHAGISVMASHNTEWEG